MRARDETLRARAGWGVFDAFGRALFSASRFARPASVEELRALLLRAREERLPVTLRGAGRTYGDGALASAGLVVDLGGLDRVLAWDPATGVLEAEPGVTIEQVWRRALPDGWWPAVVPGTMRPTLGGCLAMNVHGKNAFRAGPIGEHVLDLDLLTASGARLHLSRAERPDLFHAVPGGLGLLGAVARVRLQLKRVESGLLRVLPLRAKDLDEQLALMEQHRPEAAYLVSWVDCHARGGALGRGVIHRADAVAAADDPLGPASLRPEAQDLPPKLFGLPRGLLRHGLKPFLLGGAMGLVNLAKYQASRLGDRRPYLQAHVAFHFLLDYVPDWRLAYGERGFLQVQLFLPHAGVREALRDLLELCQRRGLPSSLGVLKRHRPDPFLLSHGLDGWSLALDFAVPAERERLWSLARELQERTLEAGGRFYPAKDATLTRAQYARGVGEEALRRFGALKREVDPEGLFESGLSRRLLQG